MQQLISDTLDPITGQALKCFGTSGLMVAQRYIGQSVLMP